jgi:hypothetical protein
MHFGCSVSKSVIKGENLSTMQGGKAHNRSTIRSNVLLYSYIQKFTN